MIENTLVIMYNTFESVVMRVSKEIRKISLASILSALSTVLIVAGSFFEILDMTCAALACLIVYITDIEIKGKYPFLVYITTSILSLIFVPLTSATLYYIAFFGYYPIIRKAFSKFKKLYRKLFCLGVFNVAMAVILLMFKAVFAMQNEPYWMYLLLLATLNIFFLSFDYVMDFFIIIYLRKIRPKLNFKL